jgi:hypothetical protein
MDPFNPLWKRSCPAPAVVASTVFVPLTRMDDRSFIRLSTYVGAFASIEVCQRSANQMERCALSE